MIRSLIALVLSIMCMLPAQAADPRLPLSSIIPGAGVTIGVDLAHECQAGTLLPGGSLGAGTVTSTQLSADTIQHVHKVLTNAQMKALHTTPINIIPAVTGKTTVLLGVMYTLTFGGSAFTSGGTVTLQYHTGTVAATTGIANTFFQGASTARTTDSIIPALAVVSDGVEASAASADFATSTSGTVTVDAAYAQY